MKNRHYGNVWKNTIILLQLLFSVLLLMSVFMVAALNGKHMIDMDNLTNQSYVDSSYYSYVYEQKVTELTNFLMLRPTGNTIRRNRSMLSNTQEAALSVTTQKKAIP